MGAELGWKRNTLWDLCSPLGTASVHCSVLPWNKCVENSQVTPRAKGRDPPLRKLRNKLEQYEGQCEGSVDGTQGTACENIVSVDCWSPQALVFLMLEELDLGVNQGSSNSQLLRGTGRVSSPSLPGCTTKEALPMFTALGAEHCQGLCSRGEP